MQHTETAWDALNFPLPLPVSWLKTVTARPPILITDVLSLPQFSFPFLPNIGRTEFSSKNAWGTTVWVASFFTFLTMSADLLLYITVFRFVSLKMPIFLIILSGTTNNLNLHFTKFKQDGMECLSWIDLRKAVSSHGTLLSKAGLKSTAVARAAYGVQLLPFWMHTGKWINQLPAENTYFLAVTLKWITLTGMEEREGYPTPGLCEKLLFSLNFLNKKQWMIFILLSKI